jgi:hypothetical protein
LPVDGHEPRILIPAPARTFQPGCGTGNLLRDRCMALPAPMSCRRPRRQVPSPLDSRPNGPGVHAHGGIEQLLKRRPLRTLRQFPKGRCSSQPLGAHAREITQPRQSGAARRSSLAFRTGLYPPPFPYDSGHVHRIPDHTWRTVALQQLRPGTPHVSVAGPVVAPQIRHPADVENPSPISCLQRYVVGRGSDHTSGDASQSTVEPWIYPKGLARW